MPDVIPSSYIHGTEPAEQRRLARLNRWINTTCLHRLRLLGGERILEVGSGLGLFARDMARATGGGQVVCVERDEGQIYRCLELAEAAGEGSLLDVRQGEALHLPLSDEEWGAFDVVHCRFVLEHVAQPQAVVQTLARTLRPGGRMILADDDHDVLRMWPPMPAVDELWRALIHTFSELGHDPFVGRKLIAMMRVADLEPVQNESLFFGGCAGLDRWDLVVDNLAGVLIGARSQILATSAIPSDVFDEVIESLEDWRQRSDSALWYQICWAEAVKPI